MATFLDDTALLDDEDAIGIGDGRQPVRNHKRGASLRKLGQRLLDGTFRFGVERRCRLVRISI